MVVCWCQDAGSGVSNAQVAAAAEAFVRRKINDLLASLPDSGVHTPPRAPHPPSTKRHGGPQRRTAGGKSGKDRKSIGDKKKDQKRTESDEDVAMQSSFCLQPRDSLILSRDRLSRERVRTVVRDPNISPGHTPAGHFSSRSFPALILHDVGHFSLPPTLTSSLQCKTIYR